MNVEGDMNVFPSTAAYRALIVCLWDAFRSTALSNAAQDGYEGEAHFFLSDTLAPNFNNLSSALTGAARTTLAYPLTSIASGAAVGFWYFFPTEKGLGLRGYERAKHHKWLVRNTNHREIKKLQIFLLK